MMERLHFKVRVFRHARGNEIAEGSLFQHTDVETRIDVNRQSPEVSVVQNFKC